MLFKSIELNMAIPISFSSEIDMSNDIKRTVSYGTAGVLIAVVIIAGLIAGTYLLRPVKGTLTVQIMDKPVGLKHLNVTIDWVKIKDDAGNWYDLTLKTKPFYFDLLALQNVSETLSEAAIPEANYTAIWIHVWSANATYPDGNTTDLYVPSDVIKILLTPSLSLEGGGQVTVLIDLQPEDMETIAISQSLNLRPVVKAIVPELEPTS
jgi:hypothetical protein